MKGGVEERGGRGKAGGKDSVLSGKGVEMRERLTLCVSVSMFVSMRSFPSQWNLTVFLTWTLVHVTEKPRERLLSPFSLTLSVLPSSSSHLLAADLHLHPSSYLSVTMLLLYNCFLSLLESIYRRGARRWRKLYRVNGHLFQAKRFNRVSALSLKIH